MYAANMAAYNHQFDSHSTVQRLDCAVKRLSRMLYNYCFVIFFPLTSSQLSIHFPSSRGIFHLLF